MSTTLRICLIVASVLMCIYTLHKIRKTQLNIDDSIYWISAAALLVVMSVFPVIPTKVAELMGIQSPVNFVYLVMIALVIIKLFLVVIDLSVQKHRLNLLVERLAVIHKETDDKINMLIEKESRSEK